MYERGYGYKYDHKEYQSAADIAKLMRRDIKEAVAFGLLPAAKYSVRVDNYAGGRSIDIHVQDWPQAWQDCDGYKVGQPRVGGVGRDLCRDYFCAAKLQLLGETKPGAQSHQVLTEDAEAALMTLERIHGAYNHDGSETQVDYFDVNYYGSVSFEDARAAKLRARETAKKAARRQAIDELTGESKRVVVYGSKGKRTVHDAVEVNGHIRLVCGATLWRHSYVSDAAGHELSCSRCQKRAAR